MRARATVPAALTGIAILLLSGCEVVMDPPTQGPVSVSQEGDQLLVAVCANIRASGFRMEERPASGAWTNFWSSDEDVTLSSGDILSSTTAHGLGVVAGEDPALTPESQLSIQIVDRGDPSANSINGVFKIPAEGLIEGRWLNPDGTTAGEPCSQY